jgi:uncharacterized membrane protein
MAKQHSFRAAAAMQCMALDFAEHAAAMERARLGVIRLAAALECHRLDEAEATIRKRGAR